MPYLLMSNLETVVLALKAEANAHRDTRDKVIVLSMHNTLM